MLKMRSMGAGTYDVPLKLYELNRDRLREKIKPLGLGKYIVVLQGGNEQNHFDTDYKYVFRQESFFLWTFGVTEPGFFGIVEAESDRTRLFIPRVPEEISWKQPLRTLEYYRRKYMVTYVHYTTEIVDILKELRPDVLLTLHGINSDSGLPSLEASFPGIERFKVNRDVLYPIIANLRVYKSFYEYEVMKYVIEVVSFAHKRVMRAAKPGKSEYLCESEFINYVYGAGGCRFLAGPVVCANGRNTTYLCYGEGATPNDGFIEQGEFCLFGMGASYFGYCASVTCTFPSDGKFSDKQKVIYETVLNVLREVIRKARPGVSLLELHLMGNKLLLENLAREGILKGSISEMLEAGVAAVFQPHGIGHFIGLDLHDVGGYLEGYPPRSMKDEGTKDLRTTRQLEEGMFLVICPGCYFIDALLSKALKDPKLSKFLVSETINVYRDVGGVRLADDVYIHNLGAVSLTKVPRTVEQIEDWLAGIDDYEYPPNMERRVSSVRFLGGVNS